jgi:hypothetical protein
MIRITLYLNLALALLFLLLPASSAAAREVDVLNQLSIRLPDGFFAVIPPEKFANFKIDKEQADWAAWGFYDNVAFDIQVKFYESADTQADIDSLLEALKNQGTDTERMKIGSLYAAAIAHETKTSYALALTIPNGEESCRVYFSGKNNTGQQGSTIDLTLQAVNSIKFAGDYTPPAAPAMPAVTPTRPPAAPTRPAVTPTRPPAAPERLDEQRLMEQIIRDILS